MNIFAMIMVMGATFWVFQWGIPWLLKRFPKPAWRYPANTAVEMLHRHHRFSAAFVYLCFLCIVGLASSLLQVLVLGWQGWAFYFLIVYGAGMVGSIVPAIVLACWMGEIERECRERGVPVPTMESFRAMIKAETLKLSFWILLAIASPWIFRIALRS